MVMNDEPDNVLGDARRAYASGDYALALDKYRWFYEHAVEIKESYYGVRLSYCLGEWSELAACYPPAMEELTQLKMAALEKFDKTMSRQNFHEYSAIAGCLNQEKEVLDRFLLVEAANDALAEQIFSFVYDHCVEREMWGVCYRYVGDGIRQYEKVMEIFDRVAILARDRGDERITEAAKRIFKKEVLRLRNIMAHCGTEEQSRRLEARMQSDLQERGYEMGSF